MSRGSSALSHDDLARLAALVDGAEQAALAVGVVFEQALRSATRRWLRL
jgi:hypothetical protein